MAVILALDTSTEACSCALSIEGVVHENHQLAPRRHAQLILPMLRDLLLAHALDFAALDAIAFGRGPGSFTGLRIAAGVTQGLAFASSLPVLAVSTLAALALDIGRETGAREVMATLDARIDELYWGLFRVESGRVEPLGEEHLCKPEELRLPPVAGGDGDWAAGGNGLDYLARFPGAVGRRLNPKLSTLLPRAGAIAELAVFALERGETITPEAVRPVYLRDKVTQVAGG